MYNRLINTLSRNRLWIIAITSLNIIFGFLLWISNSSAFTYIFPTMIFASLMLYFSIVFYLYKSDSRREDALIEFIDYPNKDKEEDIRRVFTYSESVLILKIGEVLREKDNLIKSQKHGIDEYEEYIESWAHEIKTPLGLMTLILDNRREELSPYLYSRLEYARTKIHDDIERMLYYARIKSSGKDYFLMPLLLSDICNDVIDEYSILLKEHNIKYSIDIKECSIVSDKKSLRFMLKQIISNSIKYKDTSQNSSYISIFSVEDGNQIKLTIRDNGIGIKPYDLPFIFDKGFTGEKGEHRKNSTGIGLYLVKTIADDLKVNIEVNELYNKGFEIRLGFPIT
ncbi:MAG: sensor histidine kinase [Clostridium sp.]